MRYLFLTGVCVALALGCASVEGRYRSAVRSRDENRILKFMRGNPQAGALVMQAASVLDTVRFERAAADTGIVSLQHFVQTYPTNPLAPNASLLLAERIRHRDIARLTAEVESDPQPEPLVALAGLHYDDGDFDAADSLYRRAIALAPDNASAHTGLARAYLDQGMVDEADSEIEIAQRLAPTDVNVLLAAGEYYRLVGRPDLAIASFQSVLNSSPDNADAHMELGLVYLDIGRNRNAVWEFLRVRELDGRNVVSLYYLAAAYADQGDGATALRHLSTYLNSPHSAEEAEVLANARVLYDRLKSEVRTGMGTGGEVFADPSNPEPKPAQPQTQKPGATKQPPASGRPPVGGGRVGAIGTVGGRRGR
ncbi:tetratricopeptide repeat protein [Candidatus Fermentibacteria bacterium]|nr:tetratricopeptide repeat protein [Candidatus Fermentibacteria bacterium]